MLVDLCLTRQHSASQGAVAGRSVEMAQLKGECSEGAGACGTCREQTMHWAIWQQMKSPSKGFEDVVRTHFKQRQKHVSMLPCNESAELIMRVSS